MPSPAAKAWLRQEIEAIEQPETLVRAYFDTAPPSDRERVSAGVAPDLAAALANATRELSAEIHHLPFEHRWDVTRTLGEVCHRDPILAIQVAHRLKRPLHVRRAAPAREAPGAGTVDPAIESLAWKVAQKLVGTADAPGGLALDALLGLQGLRDEEDLSIGKAGALVAYLRATAKLGTLRPGFSSEPAYALDTTRWGVLRHHENASLALDALSALGSLEIIRKTRTSDRAAPQVTRDAPGRGGMLTAIVDHADYTVKIRGTQAQLAAVMALLWSYDERGPGARFTDDGALAYRRLTDSVDASAARPANGTWRAWGSDGAALVADTIGRVRNGPIASAAARLFSSRQVADIASTTTSMRSQPLGPGGAVYRTMPDMLGQDLDTNDKQRIAYDLHITETRDALFDFCQQRLASTNDANELMALALIAEQLHAWQGARPLDLPGDRPHVAQSPRPESFRVDAGTAERLWTQARARMVRDGQGAEAPVMASALRLFDIDPIRRQAFITRLTGVTEKETHAGSNDVPPFGRQALLEWIEGSGAMRHAEGTAWQWRGKLEQARMIAERENTLPLRRIDSEALARQWSELTDRSEPGTLYRSMKGGTVGVQLSVSLNVVPLTVAATALQSNTSGYAVGAENNGFVIRFEDERSRTLSGGLSGYGGIALASGLVGIGGSGGGAVRGSDTETRGVMFRAAVPRRAFEGDPLAVDQWRQDGKALVRILFQAAGEVKGATNNPNDFADAFAVACIGKPTLQMASRSGSAANLVFTGSGGVNARVTPASIVVQPGVFTSLAGTGTLVDHALTVEQGAAVASSSTFRTATSLTSNVAAGMSMPTLAAGGHDPAAQRFAALTVADASVVDGLLQSKVSSLYLARDSRGPIAPLMIRDTFHHDFPAWEASVKGNPTWKIGIGEERLAQYVEQAAAEYDGATSLGERWSYRPDTPAFSRYVVHERIVETLKQAVGVATDPSEKAQAEDRQRAAVEAMQTFLNDPEMLAPVGLFGIRQAQSTQTVGTGYILRATESHTQSATQLTNFEPYIARDVG